MAPVLSRVPKGRIPFYITREECVGTVSWNAGERITHPWSVLLFAYKVVRNRLPLEMTYAECLSLYKCLIFVSSY